MTPADYPHPTLNGTVTGGAVIWNGSAWVNTLVDTVAATRILAKHGSGSPNGAVTGSVGDLYTRSDGGAGSTLYVKESGAGTNTGWVAK